jgi:hypothetical protein
MSQTQAQLVGNVVTGAVFAGIVTATQFSLNGQSLVSGIGINTEGGSVGTGATVLDFRGTGISTVTVASGIGTIFIQGGGGGASVTTSDTAPTSPSDGDLWYDSVGGRLYVYYDDGDTNQWVDAAPQGGGNASAAKLEVGNTKAEIIDTGSDGRFVVTTEGTGRMTVDSSGRTLLGGVTANANGGVLQLSSGITFPATAVAATDANTLDDYEEGSWTPILADAETGGNTAASYTVNMGTYTKIGNLVRVNCTFTFPVTTGMTGGNQAHIRGLPFTTNATHQAQGAVYLRDITFSAGLTFASVWVNTSKTSAQIIVQGSGVSEVPMLVSQIASGSALIRFTLTYTV